MNLPPFSKRTLASYALDWFFIIVFGLICYGFNKLTPVYHPFSLVDLSISYPFVEHELVSLASLIAASIILPAVFIALICFLMVPGPSAVRRVPWQTLAARKIFEINVAFLGLALSELIALLLTTGMKNIFGKPRPDMLSRCNPDMEAIRDHTVGGFQGNALSPGWVLVDQTICRQTDKSILNDGFRSFPSGHSSTAWAGLLYFSLYLCAKFGVAFPYLSPFNRSIRSSTRQAAPFQAEGIASFEAERKPIFGSNSPTQLTSYKGRREEGAAPPVYLHFLLFIPVGVAIFICASRYYDYRHHGFDILSGSVIGIVSSWYAFNMYHMPLGRGAGWSWGPRNADRAFGIGVGTEGWASECDDEQMVAKRNDVEMGSMQTAYNVTRPETSMQPAVQPYDTLPPQGR